MFLVLLAVVAVAWYVVRQLYRANCTKEATILHFAEQSGKAAIELQQQTLDIKKAITEDGDKTREAVRDIK